MPDPDEFEVPEEHPCGDCGHPWREHRGGERGVTCGCGCEGFLYAPPGWE